MIRAFILFALSTASYLALLAAIIAVIDPAHLVSDHVHPHDISHVVETITGYFVLLGIYPAVAYVRVPVRRWCRSRHGLCIFCGYDLRGTPLPRCSECGRDAVAKLPLWPRSTVARAAPLLGIACMVALCAAWEYIPGTYRRDRHGFPFGTGVARYYYKTGATKLVERYTVGRGVEHTWYRPDGTIVAHEFTPNETGTGYYLREDGSIRVKMQYLNGVAQGDAIYYNRDGSTDRTVRYENGVAVDGEQLPPSGD